MPISLGSGPAQEICENRQRYPQYNPDSASYQKPDMIPPLEQNIGTPDEQSRHHARVLVSQKVAVKHRLSCVVLVLNPYPGPAVRRNNYRVSPDFFVEVHHLAEGRVLFRGELRSHLLDLESIDVDVELRDKKAKIKL